MSGLAARRKNLPGLSLNGMGTGHDASPAGRMGANGTIAGGLSGKAPASRKPPGLTLGSMRSSSTPFANFNKIV